MVSRHDHRIMVCYPTHRAAMPREELRTGVQLCATRARYPVHRPKTAALTAPRKPDAIRGPSASLTVADELPAIPDELLPLENVHRRARHEQIIGRDPGEIPVVHVA